MTEQQPIDPERILAILEEHLLGGTPTLSGVEVADRTGIAFEMARGRWRALGFTASEDDEIAFTEADVEAMELTQVMHDLGLMTPSDESAMIRTLGRTFARLAEWQVGLLARALDPGSLTEDGLRDMLAEVTPVIESVQRYVWRRHLIAAASRLLLAPPVDDADDGQLVGIGFADIVGYTRQTRSMKRAELARLVEDFEANASRIVTEHGGRIIKMIGDEILYSADTPVATATIALRLVEGHLDDEDFPELRVGVAWGPVLPRLGDVFGPTVNLAARLTSIAKPGRVLGDRALADELRDDPDFSLRRSRRASVKGYRHLEPWKIRRPLVDVDSSGEDGRDVVGTVDEVDVLAEGPVGAEGAE